MSCPAQRFTGIGPAVLASLQQKGAAAGLPIAGHTGKATTLGVTLQWNYDAATETLEIEVVEKPFFVPCPAIAGRVQELIDSCL